MFYIDFEAHTFISLMVFLFLFDDGSEARSFIFLVFFCFITYAEAQTFIILMRFFVFLPNLKLAP